MLELSKFPKSECVTGELSIPKSLWPSSPLCTASELLHLRIFLRMHRSGTNYFEVFGKC